MREDIGVLFVGSLLLHKFLLAAVDKGEQIRVSLSTHKVGGIRGVAVKCLDITKNSDCEGSSLERN